MNAILVPEVCALLLVKMIACEWVRAIEMHQVMFASTSACAVKEDFGTIRLSDPDQDSQWISVQIHLVNRMTLGVSNVSRIHFGFGFIVNPDPDPIIEYPFCNHQLIAKIYADSALLAEESAVCMSLVDIAYHGLRHYLWSLQLHVVATYTVSIPPSLK